MRKGLPLLACLGAVFFLAVYLLAGYDMRAGNELPLYSSRRYDPFGVSALRELAGHRGWDTRFLERPAPPAESDATLIMTLPLDTPDGDADEPERGDHVGRFGKRRIARLMAWAEQGNAVVILTREMPRHLAAATVAVEPGPRAEAERLEKLQASGGYVKALAEPGSLVEAASAASGAAKLYLVRPSGIPGREDGAGESEPLALRRGMGRIVVIPDPTPALNFALASADNADFLLSLLGDGPVYFDEYSLGLGQEDSTLDWIRRQGLVPFLLQALLALFLLARSADSDFGHAASAAPDGETPAAEQIRVLAGLYEKTLSDAELERKRRALFAKTPKS